MMTTFPQSASSSLAGDRMKHLASGFVWIAVALAAVPATATMLMRRVPLELAATEATRIVHATVIDVHSDRDEWGAPATWITLDVARTLKGAVPRHLTIKQLGTAAPLSDGVLTRIPGLPRYAVGEELVLFLRDDSAHGFTSPVGLGQGVYRVVRRGGRRTVQGDLSRKEEDLTAFLARVERLTGQGH